MSSPEDCPRITSRLDLPRWLCQKGLVGYGAEIGVLFGEYSAHVLEYWPGTLYMIDPWVNQDPSIYLDGCNSVLMPAAYRKAQAAVERFGKRAIPVRKFSQDAADGVCDGSLHWAYIDANHSLESMRQDLPKWWSKIAPGGLLAGHDFYDRHDDWHDCGVETAVREFCAERGLKFYTTECTSWWVGKG